MVRQCYILFDFGVSKCPVIALESTRVFVEVQTKDIFVSFVLIRKFLMRFLVWVFAEDLAGLFHVALYVVDLVMLGLYDFMCC